MSESDEQTHEAIGRHWDALVRGEPPPPLDLDPALRDAIAWAIERDDAPDPDGAFVRRLEAQLLAGTSAGPGTRPAERPHAMNGHATFSPRDHAILAGRTSQPGWTWSQLVTAALIVLTLTAGLLTHRTWERRSQEAIIPAPADAIERETLINEPPGSLPSGSTSVAVLRCRVDPGASVGDGQSAGSLFFAVEAGDVQVALSGSEQALSAGETLAGTTSAGYRLRNTGTTVADVTGVQLLTSAPRSSEREGNAAGASCTTPIAAAVTLPVGPGWTRLERLTVPVGAVAPALLATGADWIAIESGRAGVTLDGGTLPWGWHAGEERAYAAGKQLPLLPTGTRATLRNAGDGPLVLLRLTVP